jgi:hypothetical protein
MNVVWEGRKGGGRARVEVLFDQPQPRKKSAGRDLLLRFPSDDATQEEKVCSGERQVEDMQISFCAKRLRQSRVTSL